MPLTLMLPSEKIGLIGLCLCKNQVWRRWFAISYFLLLLCLLVYAVDPINIIVFLNMSYWTLPKARIFCNWFDILLSSISWCMRNHCTVICHYTVKWVKKYYGNILFKFMHLCAVFVKQIVMEKDNRGCCILFNKYFYFRLVSKPILIA